MTDRYRTLPDPPHPAADGALTGRADDAVGGRAPGGARSAGPVGDGDRGSDRARSVGEDPVGDPYRVTDGVTPAARRDLACVGDNCVDVLVAHGRREAGGNAFNVAVVAARQGRSSAYLGAVGRDADADLILGAAYAAGVDVTGVQRRDAATGVTVVEHRCGSERTFVEEHYGAAAEYRLDADSAAVAAAHRWVHAARQPDLARWSAEIRDGGTGPTTISVDVGDEGDPETFAALARHVDVVFASSGGVATAGRRLTVEALGAGVPLVVVTDGAKGAIAATRTRSWRQPALPVAEVVDTLGAGDAFIAAFVGGMLDTDDVQEALRRGAAAGAAAVTRLGLASPSPNAELSS